MNNLLVSVIIPVYKVEQYLQECVDSVLNQTYKNFEIILVDDGSPDHCPKICDEYAQKDNRIKVIHKENGGLSDARNVGLEKALGDYIVFIDSDDFWKSSEELSYLVDKVSEYNYPDFVGYNMCNYFTEGNKYVKWVSYGDNITTEQTKEKLIIELVKTGSFPMSACSKIINKTFLVSNNIRFIKGIISEDIPWFLELLEKSQNIRYTNRYVYCYRKQRNGSITNLFSTKKYDDVYNIIINAVNNIQNSDYKKDTKDALLSFCTYYYCILLGEHLNFGKDMREVKFLELRKLNWLFEYEINPKVKKVRFIYKLLGLKITAVICHLYLKYILK